MSDAQQAAEGKVVMVGVGQLNNPTPTWAKYMFRIILYLSGLWALLAPQFADIDPAIAASINKWLLIGNTLINFSIKFIGWDMPSESGK